MTLSLAPSLMQREEHAPNLMHLILCAHTVKRDDQKNDLTLGCGRHVAKDIHCSKYPRLLSIAERGWRAITTQNAWESEGYMLEILRGSLRKRQGDCPILTLVVLRRINISRK